MFSVCIDEKTVVSVSAIVVAPVRALRGAAKAFVDLVVESLIRITFTDNRRFVKESVQYPGGAKQRVVHHSLQRVGRESTCRRPARAKTKPNDVHIRLSFDAAHQKVGAVGCRNH